MIITVRLHAASLRPWYQHADAERLTLGADVVMLDLEDAAPDDAEARET
jgi:citrate lyase beta subunit